VPEIHSPAAGALPDTGRSERQRKTSLLDVVAFVQDLVREGAETAVRKRARSLRELVWQQEGDSFELALELTLPNASTDTPVQAARYEVRVGLDSHDAVALLGENLWLLNAIREKSRTLSSQLCSLPSV
jgi:hypothetical protein